MNNGLIVLATDQIANKKMPCPCLKVLTISVPKKEAIDRYNKQVGEHHATLRVELQSYD